MLSPSALRVALLGAVLLTGGIATSQAQRPATPAPCAAGTARPGTTILVFSRTTGFRHSSIPTGIAAVTELGKQHRFTVVATEDPTVFTDPGLRRFAVVVFLSTTGNVLDSAQQASFERYIRGGGGFVGVHSATDTEYGWPWYGQLVGAYFKRHPAIQQATLHVVDRSHQATRCLGPSWTRTDEWYDFRAQPPKEATILVTLDEGTYSGGTMGALHPVAWYRPFEGGRSFYTELGHTEESYAEPAYLNHLVGGILWAAGR